MCLKTFGFLAFLFGSPILLSFYFFDNYNKQPYTAYKDLLSVLFLLAYIKLIDKRLLCK